MGDHCFESTPVSKIFKTSIIIVTYNSHRQVQACVNSIHKHTQGPYEILIVDNASSDATRDYLRGLKGIKVILNSDNRGYAAAANQGIADCTGDYIILLNPDTMVSIGWNQRLMAHFQKGVGAVGPVSNFAAGRQKIEVYLDMDQAGEWDIDQTAIQCAKRNRGRSVATKLLIGFCLMISRQAFEKVGDLDENLFLGNDDLDYCHRLRLCGFELRVAIDTFIFHRGQESFKTVGEGQTRGLVQESTDYLYYKLMRHYGLNSIPSAMALWGMDWFQPQVAFQESLPLVSIVVLTFNQLAYTKQCIESVLRHTGSPFELIVVDNGSSDGTLDYLSGLSFTGKACIRLHIIANQENAGFAGGCNQGLAVARGDYHLLLNNDVIVTDGWLRRLVAPLQEIPHIGIVGPMTNQVSGPQLVTAPAYDVNQVLGLTDYAAVHAAQHGDSLKSSWRLAGFCLLIRREVVEKIGGLDTRYNLGNFEDDDFCFRAHLAGFKAVIVQGCYVHHFGGRTFEGNDIDFNAQTARNWELFKQKWHLPHDLPHSDHYQIHKPPGGFDPAEHFCALPSSGQNGLMPTAETRSVSRIDPNTTPANVEHYQNSKSRQNLTDGSIESGSLAETKSPGAVCPAARSCLVVDPGKGKHVLSIPLKEYSATLNGNLNGRMIALDSLARLDGKAPYMTILDHVVVIGPLLVHMPRDGGLMAVDAENGTVSGDFGGAQSQLARTQLEKECGAPKSGSFVMLWHIRSLNFWHWIMEALPKVLMAEAGGFTGTYIIPPEDSKSPFIGESLALMGVTSQRIVAYDGQPWCLERLYLPQPIEGVYALMDYPKIIETLRSRLLDACKPSPYRLDRLYIARSGDVQRRLINETPLLQSLFKHEFQRVVIEHFPLREQIRMASQARCLVAPHGAGMVHCLFMPPGSLVLEIFNANYVNPCMLPAIDYLRHRYFMIPSAGLNPTGTEDITAFIRPIEITLRREIDLQNRAVSAPLLMS